MGNNHRKDKKIPKNKKTKTKIPPKNNTNVEYVDEINNSYISRDQEDLKATTALL